MRRRAAAVAGERDAPVLAAELGRAVRERRRLLRLTQAQLGALVGLGAARISEIERGEGGGAPLATWIALGRALGRPFHASLGWPRRFEAGEPADAGHLGAQELLLRLAPASGRTGTFELPTRPADPARSADVAIRDDRARTLVLAEVWNTFGDLGAAARSTSRKIAEMGQLAVVLGGDGPPYRVVACWVVRATAANRALLARYPSIFRSRFPGPSAAWVRALTCGGVVPPAEPGLAWVDVPGTRLFPVRWPAD